MQVHSIPRVAPALPARWPFTALKALVFITLGLAATAQSKDIGILVDRSMSVFQPNRDEAVRLIDGLLSGKIDPSIRGNWRLLDESGSEDDPDQREIRKMEISQLKTLIDGADGNPLATGKFRLFLGEFGDIETVRTLTTAEWRDAEGDVSSTVEPWAKASVPSDKETHFELARATAAAKLGAAQEFYFFVVSDGVEDLVNWPVSDYLDATKLKDDAALERGDFRDTTKGKSLELMNLKRRGGDPITLRGKIRPGYDAADRGTIDNFRKTFSERLVGQFTLKGPELRKFFSANPGKVPVNVYVYSARPKETLSLRFTTPAGSTPKTPHPLSLAAPDLKWNIALPSGETASDYRLELVILEPTAGAEVGRKSVNTEGCSIFEAFPDLKNGDYELRLVATKGSRKPIQTAAFVQVKKSAPVLAFTDDFARASERSSARTFDPKRDGDILGRKISWKWSSENSDLAAPTKIERSLGYFTEADSDQKANAGTSSPLSSISTSLTLRELLVSNESQAEPLPLGGTYRLQLRAEWADGSKAIASAWFVLPEPKLNILNKRSAVESEEAPRPVAKGDLIKIGNWMHLWKNFDYELAVFQRDGDSWKPFEGPASEFPLELDNKDSNGAKIHVNKDFSGVLKYEVRFVPEKESERDLVELPTAVGFVESSGKPILPWLIGIMLVLTISFFAWNLMRKK